MPDWTWAQSSKEPVTESFRQTAILTFFWSPGFGLFLVGTSLGETEDRRLFLCATVLHAEMRSRANESPGGPCLLGTNMGQKEHFPACVPGSSTNLVGLLWGDEVRTRSAWNNSIFCCQSCFCRGVETRLGGLFPGKRQLGSGECISSYRGAAQSTEPRLLKQLGGFRNRGWGRWLCWSAAPLTGRLGRAACQESAPVSL